MTKNKRALEALKDMKNRTYQNLWTLGVHDKSALVYSNLEQECQTIREALEEKPVDVEGWQPIQSAPNTGRFLFIMDDRTIHIHGCDWDDEYTDWIAYDGINENHKGISKPTHWMTLPEPPKKNTTGVTQRKPKKPYQEETMTKNKRALEALKDIQENETLQQSTKVE